MTTPSLSLPPSARSDPLPELPNELLLTLHQNLEKDALDSFILGSTGGGASGGVQVDDILNELIPDESALPRVPLVSLLLRSRIQDIRMEIEKLKEQLDLDQTPSSMSAVQELIGELLFQVTAIRDAATESEMLVRDITREIQSLDLAKKNLIASMNALKRFQMLVNAFDQLTRLMKARRYRETAQALGAVKQLSQYFKAFSSVERVAAVSRGVIELQGQLRAQVLKDFAEAFANETARAGKNSLLTDACLVVDGLGEDAKGQLLTWYAQLVLRDYRRVFASLSEAGQLDNISRRFAWFRRVLKTHEDENAVIFPMAWNVGAVLAGSFSEVTRDDLKSVLSKAASTLQIGLLLESISHTTDFEREMARKYSMPFESVAALSVLGLGRSGSAPIISSVFEPYLGIFVDAQDKNLREMLAGFSSSRVSLSPSDNPSAVLPSSTELFYFYRETLEQCAKLSIRQPLLDLCRLYKKWLKVYAEDILSELLIRYDRRSSGEGRPSVRELQTSCLVLNTAEYCHETATQLEERLQQKIHPDYRDRISLESEKEIFLGNISSALLAILRELEMTIEGPFTQMARSPWRETEFVSSESAYAGELVKLVQLAVRVVREGLEQKKYVRSVCDKVVGLVLAKLTQTIVKCRPIAQIGAEQILLDLQSLKTCFLHLPLAPGDMAPVPTSYARYVTRSVLKVDTMLKVIMTPEEPAEDFVQHYLLLVPCQSFSDFQKILDLKGVRRSDQSHLMDLFLARTSTATGLNDSSFLTALDMDPNSHSFTSPQSSSGVNSPSVSHLSIFGGALPLLPGAAAAGLSGGSRDGSRVATPLNQVVGSMGGMTGGGGGGSGGVGGTTSSGSNKGSGVSGEDRGKEAFQEFKRFGARIAMFGGRQNSTTH